METLVGDVIFPELRDRVVVGVSMRTALLIAIAVLGCGGAQTARAPVPGNSAKAAVASTPVPRATPPPPPVAKTQEEPGDASLGLRPCTEASSDYRVAKVALEDLDQTAGALSLEGDPKPFGTKLRALLQLPCFEFAAKASTDLGIPNSGASVKTFWGDGEAWLQRSLTIAKTRELWFPPPFEHTLSWETHPKHPLRDPLLCSLKAPSCGLETAGWARRAETALRPARELPIEDGTPTPEQRCAEGAKNQALADRFNIWKACVEKLVKTRQRLPLGRMRAPKSGWLIVRGRRGHYRFCDEVRAYNLANGAAYIAQSCSGLALGQPGRVNRRATDNARQTRVRRGYLPIDNLRETAWMFLHTLEKPSYGRSHNQYFRIPEHVALLRNVGDIFGSGASSSTSSSNQTQLAWTLMIKGVAKLGGTLTWPTDYNRKRFAHAVQLLAIAEEGFTEECSSTAPPSLAKLGGPKPGVSRVDATADELSAVERSLVATLATESRRRCKSKRRKRR